MDQYPLRNFVHGRIETSLIKLQKHLKKHKLDEPKSCLNKRPDFLLSFTDLMCVKKGDSGNKALRAICKNENPI